MGWGLEVILAMVVIMDMVAILSTTIMDSIIITDSITGAVVNESLFYFNQIHEKSISGSTFLTFKKLCHLLIMDIT